MPKIKMPLREPRLRALHISVPLTPVSVNHYKKPRANNRGYYVTKEALAFKAAVAVLSKGSVEAAAYYVAVVVFFGKGERGDAGNLEKCIGDGLQEAGIISNDSRTKRYQIEVSRDWKDPRTEIYVCALADAPNDKGWVEKVTLEKRVAELKGGTPETQPKKGLCPCHGVAFCRQYHGL